MSSVTCPNCGAPLPPGAGFCSYCGRPVVPAAGPLPSAGPAASSVPPAPTTEYAPPAPAPAPRRRVRWVVVVVAVVIVLIVATVVAAYLLFPAPPIQVEGINIYAPDNVCGLNSNPIGYYGFNSSTSAVQTLEFEIPSFNATSCSIVSVVTNTSGFLVTPSGLPLSIPGEGNGFLNLTITSPSSPFTGLLNLVFA